VERIVMGVDVTLVEHTQKMYTVQRGRDQPRLAGQRRLERRCRHLKAGVEWYWENDRERLRALLIACAVVSGHQRLGWL